MNKTDEQIKDEMWEKHFEDMQKLPTYSVFEWTKSAGQSVAMSLEELSKFCKDFSLPVFTLDVDRIAQMGFTQDVGRRYRTWFTVFQGFTFYASKYLDEKGDVKNVEGATKESGGKES